MRLWILMMPLLLAGCAGSRSAGSKAGDKEKDFLYFQAFSEAQAVCGAFGGIEDCMEKEYGCAPGMPDRACGKKIYDSQERKMKGGDK